MGCKRNLPVSLAVLTLVAYGSGISPAQADDILVNGNFEASVSPPNWTLTTSVTGLPGVTIPRG